MITLVQTMERALKTRISPDSWVRKLLRRGKDVTIGRGPLVLYLGLRARTRTIGRHSLERDILVTGCGASGTTYVWKLLRHNGVAVTHDACLGRDGIVTNACNGEYVSVLVWHKNGAGYYTLLMMPVQEFTYVIHLVRHPLKTIGSAYQKWLNSGRIWPHVARELFPGESPAEVTKRAACQYWLSWNEKIEPVATARLRVEDLSDDPSVLFERIGRRYRWPYQPGRKVASSGSQWYPTWEELASIDEDLCRRIQQKALFYGYDLYEQ